VTAAGGIDREFSLKRSWFGALREKVGTGFSQKAMRQRRLLEHWAIQTNRPML
jgi:hypothetical protein